MTKGIAINIFQLKRFKIPQKNTLLLSDLLYKIGNFILFQNLKVSLADPFGNIRVHIISQIYHSINSSGITTIKYKFFFYFKHFIYFLYIP